VRRLSLMPPMKPSSLLPEFHLFVCANRREAGSPLGRGCSDEGDALYEALKGEVARRGLIPTVWVTRTQCLGLCPKSGAAVAAYPRQQMWGEATATDAPGLIDVALLG